MHVAMLNILHFLGPVSYLKYNSSFDSIQLNYKICNFYNDDSEHIGASINCSEADEEINLSVYLPDVSINVESSFNIIGLKPSTNYICCLTPEWISAILPPITCFNISTNKEPDIFPHG